MSNRTLNLTDKLYDYLLSVSLREVSVLTELREVTAKLSSHQMQIAPEQGQFLAMLVRLMGARNCIEIGVYTGYSSTSIALALPSNGKLLACDVNEEWTQLAQTFWQKAGVTQKIELRLAPAIETLNDLIKKQQENSFDFVFIDADKASYDDYYEKALLLVRKGGLIIFDNTLWGGDVADATVQDNSTKALRLLNEKLYADERIDLSLVPIGDGTTLAMKR